MKINITHNENEYQIDPENGTSISIPVKFNNNQNPKFYDVSNPEKKYFQSSGVEYNINKGAGCNVPTITMNIHCAGTHTETANHVLKNAPLISDLKNLNFIPSQLVSVNPERQIYEKYHVSYSKSDSIITKKQLQKLIDTTHNAFTDSIIIRTLPNHEDKKSRNYNLNHHPFLSNDAINFIKRIGFQHIVIDTPSIDRYEDDGKLGNHKLFFTSDDGKVNNNTITELAFIPNNCLDGKYFLCIGIPSLDLDAAPSHPIIYKIRN